MAVIKYKNSQGEWESINLGSGASDITINDDGQAPNPDKSSAWVDLSDLLIEGIDVVEETNSTNVPMSRVKGNWVSSKPKGGYNRKLYELAGAKFNEQTGFYELNGLTDITEEEMLTIYNDGICKLGENTNFTGWYDNSKARTNLVPRSTQGGWIPRALDQAFVTIPNMEVIRLSEEGKNFDFSTARFFLHQNKPILKKILGVLNCWSTGSSLDFSYAQYPLLEYFKIKSLRSNLNIKGMPKLSKESLKYMVENRTNSNPITITLHPDVYNKVSSASAIWGDLFTLAQSKQISFAQA